MHSAGCDLPVFTVGLGLPVYTVGLWLTFSTEPLGVQVRPAGVAAPPGSQALNHLQSPFFTRVGPWSGELS